MIKKIMSDRCAAALAYSVVPLVIGISYIAKFFFLEDCYVFETNDEVAHTFLEIPLAWKIVGEGMLPLMNLFNNFGTPLIGDPVVNPFALHTIPYLLFSAPAAATLNRFLAISLTISLLTLLYHRYFLLSLLASSIAAIWVVTLPAFNHFSLHHPHQGVVLYFTAILIMQHEFKLNPNMKTLTCLYVALLFFALGVGLNPFFFAWPFLFLNQFFLSDCRIDKHFILFALLSLAVFIFLYPHLYSFFQYSSLTARAALDYAQLLPFTLGRLLRDVFFFRTQAAFLHVTDVVYYSLPAIFLVAAGFWTLKDKKDGLRIAILGVVPFFTVMLMLLFGQIRSSWIPFLKPVDITRFLWFANIFLAVLLGHALDRIREGSLSEPLRAALLFLLLLSLFNVFQVAILTGLFGLVLAGLLGAFRAIMAKISKEKLLNFDLILASFFNRKNPGLFLLVAVGALFFSFSHVYISYAGLGNYLQSCDSYGYAKAYYADFHPKKYLEIMQPYKRLATQFEPTTISYMQQAAKRNIFGSDGRSIILNAGLKKFLSYHDLIREGFYGMTYYFTSTNAEKMGLLGIRYVLAKQPYGFEATHWKKPNVNAQMLVPHGRVQQAYLYENRSAISVGYLTSGQEIRYLHNLAFRGNGISITLPELRKEFNLVLTFVNWPGWVVWIDGQPGELLASDAGFLKTVVKPGNKSVVFEFQPYTVPQIASFVAGSLLMFGMTVILFLILRRQELLSQYKHDSGRCA